MNGDAEQTPTEGRQFIEEVDAALGILGARLEEVASTVRSGRARFRGMPARERMDFLRRVASLLEIVETFAAFYRHLVADEFLPHRDAPTPRELVAATATGDTRALRRPLRLGGWAKVLTALATLLGGAAAAWRTFRGK